MRIMLPIKLDRWRNPISTLLRNCVEANPDIEFHSCSRPDSEEDRVLGDAFWQLPNIVKNRQTSMAFTRYDGVHTASITLHNQAAAIFVKARTAGKSRYLATVNLQVGPHDGKDWSLLKIAEYLADGIVAVSTAASDGVKQRCADRFLQIIPNGFDAAYYDPQIEDQEVLPAAVRDLTPGSFALYVGALEPRKHPEFVVELARRHPEIVFVGAGYIHPDGHHFVPMMHSLPNLLWLGHVDRRCIRALMRHAGVFVFPSEREGLALSVIEAMGMGLPVIGQPKTSMPELIRDASNGRLHDICEIHSWSESLLYYLGRNRDEQCVFGKITRASAVDLYSWNAIGREYGAIYRRLFA